MRKILPRALVVLILMIKAATVVIPDFSVELLAMAGIPLLALCFSLFYRKGVPLSYRLHWVGAVAAIVFFILPLGPLPDWGEPETLRMLLKGLGDTLGEPVCAVSLLAVLALSFFMRKRESVLFIIFRYLAAGLFLLGMCYEVFRYSEACMWLVGLIVVSSFSKEISAYAGGRRVYAMLRCFVTVFVFFLIGNYTGQSTVAKQIDMLFRMGGSNWIVPTLGVFIMALLVLMDDYENRGGAESIFKSHNVGWTMLVWCLISIVMNKWNQFMHPAVLYLGVPLMGMVCNILMNEVGKKHDLGLVFAGVWAYLGLSLLMFAKSVNMELLLRYVLLAALIFVCFRWKQILGSTLGSGAMARIMGVFAVVVLATMNLTELEALMDEPTFLLAVIVACVMWFVLCAYTDKLSAGRSEAYKEEFVPVDRTRLAVSCATLALAVFKVLFVL